MVRWEGGRFLFFLRVEGMQGKSKISSFLFLLVKGKNGLVGFKIFLHGGRDRKTLF